MDLVSPRERALHPGATAVAVDFPAQADRLSRPADAESRVKAGAATLAARLTQNRFLLALGIVWGVVWISMAINPVNRADWLVENVIVFGSIPLVARAYRRLPLSNFSYGLIGAFLILHTIGAHYAYRLPLGDWAKEAFGWQRNHYDRVVHFGFGLLLAYPFRELFMRTATAHRFWCWWVPVISVAGLSAIFEGVEMVVAWIADPELGAAYLGTQGDEWDAQKDMALATCGAVVASTLAPFFPEQLRACGKSAAREAE